MESVKRSIILSLLAFAVSTLAFVFNAQAQAADQGSPAGTYLAIVGGPNSAIRLLLTVNRDGTVGFSSTTDFGAIGAKASPSYGTWTQRGNSIDFVAWSFIFNGTTGAPEQTEVIRGTAVTNDAFKTAEIDATLDFYNLPKNPLVDDPDASLPLTAAATRIPAP